MQIIDHEHETCEEWRSGVTTRMRVSSLTGTAQLCLFEQWCAPGSGAPTHLHAVEEVLSVVAGRAEVWVEEERGMLGANQSLIIPVGDAGTASAMSGTPFCTCKQRSAASSFEASFDDPRELSRRWLPRSPTPELR